MVAIVMAIIEMIIIVIENIKVTAAEP